MQLRLKVSIRSLIIAIAIIGIVLGIRSEWRNRRMRDGSASGEAFALDEARRHDQWLTECRSNDLCHIPYDLKRNEGYIGHPSLSTFKSWAEEADFHKEWAEGYRQQARELAERKRFYHRRLLFP